MSTMDTETMDRIDHLALIRQHARSIDAAQHQLRADVLAAVAAGVSVTQIAEAAGISRDTIYRWGRES